METNELRTAYMQEVAKAWEEQRMLKYFEKNLSECYEFNGKLFAFEKQSIITEFCFGYSLTHCEPNEYENANKMVEHSLTKESYFIEKNLEEFNHLLDLLEKGRADQKTYLLRASYTCQKEPLNLWKAVFYNYEYLERARINGSEIVEITDAEKQFYIDCVKKEKEKHLKKINTYLKKYGLSKVRSWSYWRDE